MAIEEIEPGEGKKAITGKATGEKGIGVYGNGKAVGVRGDGETWHGVAGLSKSTTGGNGVYGKNTAGGTGIRGESDDWIGVYGMSTGTKGGAAGVLGEHKANGAGVIGKSQDGIAVFGKSRNHEGVHAETESTATAAMAVYQRNPVSNQPALFAKHTGNRRAARFEGDVEVTGDIRLTNADCAEDFNIGTNVNVEPGTVMVLGEEGALFPSQGAYDKRVAGVISGAGNYKPGIVLDKQESVTNRKPIALLGKVYCKVDASYNPVEVGDLLTTSDTPGYAMKAADPRKAFGAVIGKALHSLKKGRGLIPILIALH
jgi:hypothetical protein